MDDTLKALLAKVWKGEPLHLEPGVHEFEETVTVRVSGTVEKKADQYVAATTSLPTILTIALLLQKSGVTGPHALNLLKQCISEAMANGKSKDKEIAAQVKEVEKVVETVKRDLIAKLPKQKRSGRVVTKDLEIEVTPVFEFEVEPAAA
jgi:hypothetical protein